MSRRKLLIGVVVGAVVVAALVVGIAVATSGGGSKTPTKAAHAAEVNSFFRGIPQQGATLGSAKAPVTLVEFADIQCPYCGEWAKGALPDLVSRYVRTGKVKIVFNGMAFVGTDSEKGLRTVLAAGQQNKLWNVLELLYENQGTENTGWVTDSLLESVGASVPGLDGKKMLAARDSAAVTKALAEASAVAQNAGVNSTPTFAVGPSGGTLKVVDLKSLDLAGLQPAIDAALAE